MPTVSSVKLSIESTRPTPGLPTEIRYSWRVKVEFTTKFSAEEIAARTRFQVGIDLRGADSGEIPTGGSHLLSNPPLYSFKLSRWGLFATIPGVTPSTVIRNPGSILTAVAGEPLPRVYEAIVPYDVLNEDPGIEEKFDSTLGRVIRIRNPHEDEIFAIIRLCPEVSGKSNTVKIEQLLPPEQVA